MTSVTNTPDLEFSDSEDRLLDRARLWGAVDRELRT